MARGPFASPDPLLPASLLAFRDCSWLCSTNIISFVGDITNLNLSALRLLRNRRLVETRFPVLSHRLHRASAGAAIRLREGGTLAWFGAAGSLRSNHAV